MKSLKLSINVTKKGRFFYSQRRLVFKISLISTAISLLRKGLCLHVIKKSICGIYILKNICRILVVTTKLTRSDKCWGRFSVSIMAKFQKPLISPSDKRSLEQLQNMSIRTLYDS